MQNYFSYLLYLFAISIHSSCSQESIESGHIIIDPNQYTTIHFEEHFNIDRIISLDSAPDAHLLFPHKMIIHEGFIHILDRHLKEIKVFDQSGKFVRKEPIDIEGDGPGSMWSLTDMVLHKGVMYYLSPLGEVIYLEEGKAQKLIRPLEQVQNVAMFEFINSDTIVYHSNYESYNLYFYSISRQEVIYSAFANKGCSVFIETSPLFYRNNNDKLFYYNRGENAIYEIQNDLSLERVYTIDMGGHTLTGEDCTHLSKLDTDDKLSYLEDSKKAVLTPNFQMSEDIISISMIYSSRTPLYYISDHAANRKKDRLYKLENHPSSFVPSLYYDGVLLWGAIFKPQSIHQFMSKELLLRYNVQIPAEDPNLILVSYTPK